MTRFPRLAFLFSISDAFWLGSAVGIWMLMWIDRKSVLVFGILLGALWVWLRFRRFFCLMLWFLLCLLPAFRLLDMENAALRVPEAGTYRITEIRSGYAIAVRGSDQVLVYEKDDLSLEETVVLSRFEPIHTSRNTGLFSFMDYAAYKKIFFSAETGRKEWGKEGDQSGSKDLKNDSHQDGEGKAGRDGSKSSGLSGSGEAVDSIREKKSERFSGSPEKGEVVAEGTGEHPLFRLFHIFRRPVWDWVASRKAASFYQLLFYGIHDNEDLEWMASLGLPLIGFVHVLRALLKRRVEAEKAGWIVLGIELVLALLFPVSVSLIRMICFVFCTQCFSSREKRLAFSILLTLLVRAEAARSMALVLPAGIIFFSRFQSGPYRKKLIQLSFCIICQILFMNKVNGLLLLVFGMMRKSLGWFVLAALPGLVFEEYGLFLAAMLEKVSLQLDLFDLHGLAPFWYMALLGIWLVSITWKWKKARAIGGVVLLSLYPIIWHFDPFFHVYLIDVGQGDATLIVSPFQRDVIMIDAAGRFNHDNASELFIPFFETRQIRHLDALVVSHGDFDHNGSVEPLMEQMEVRRLVDRGDQIVEASFPFELLLQEREADPEDENDKSLICFFAYDGFRYLWTGDASIRIEEQLIEQYNLAADILKLGHHGSDTSSSREFLQEVSCQLGLISAGYQNRFGHPKAEVLARLNELGIDRLNTADHGLVHLMSFHSLMLVETGDGLFSWMFPSVLEDAESTE